MWANAQRDGRPAEYGWRPLFNAAKFGLRRLLQCRAVMLPRRETRRNFLGVKFAVSWRHVKEILLFNNSFPDCRYMP